MKRRSDPRMRVTTPESSRSQRDRRRRRSSGSGKTTLGRELAGPSDSSAPRPRHHHQSVARRSRCGDRSRRRRTAPLERREAAPDHAPCTVRGPPSGPRRPARQWRRRGARRTLHRGAPWRAEWDALVEAAGVVPKVVWLHADAATLAARRGRTRCRAGHTHRRPVDRHPARHRAPVDRSRVVHVAAARRRPTRARSRTDHRGLRADLRPGLRRRALRPRRDPHRLDAGGEPVVGAARPRVRPRGRPARRGTRPARRRGARRDLPARAGRRSARTDHRDRGRRGRRRHRARGGGGRLWQRSATTRRRSSRVARGSSPATGSRPPASCGRRSS